jgi:hypothetical protein
VKPERLPSSAYVILSPVSDVAAVVKKTIWGTETGRESFRLSSKYENKNIAEMTEIVVSARSRTATFVGYFTSKRAADRYFSLHSMQTDGNPRGGWVL